MATGKRLVKTVAKTGTIYADWRWADHYGHRDIKRRGKKRDMRNDEHAIRQSLKRDLNKELEEL